MAKKGSKEVHVWSLQSEKKRMTVALTCTEDGKMPLALAIFKGKRNLKFRAPENVKVALQAKGWMDSELMLTWLRGVILPYTKGRRGFLVANSYSAHQKE